MEKKLSAEEVLLKHINRLERKLIAAHDELTEVQVTKISDFDSNPYLKTTVAAMEEYASQFRGEAVSDAVEWKDAKDAPFNTWLLVANKHWIGVAKRKKIDEDSYEPEWYDETMQYIPNPTHYSIKPKNPTNE